MGLGPEDIKAAFAFVDGIRKARDIAKNMDNLELKKLLVDAYDEAVNAKLLVVGYKEENAELREKLNEAARNRELLDNLVVKGSVYVWKDKALTGSKGPFCVPCFEVGKTMVTMKPFDKKPSGVCYECPHCGKYGYDYESGGLADGLGVARIMNL